MRDRCRFVGLTRPIGPSTSLVRLNRFFAEVLPFDNEPASPTSLSGGPAMRIVRIQAVESVNYG